MKMASVYMAWCQSPSIFCVFVLFLSLFTHNVNSVGVRTSNSSRFSTYDQRSGKLDCAGHKSLPPFLLQIPAQLCCAPVPPLERKRRRHCGKHGGQLVKLKASLGRFSKVSWTPIGATSHIFISLCFLDPVDSWLIPVVSSYEMSQPCPPCFPHPRHHGVNLYNLRVVSWVPRSVDALKLLVPARMALINASSLVNKTFVLKDFFTAWGLDFLFVTGTWLKVGESSTFTELLPQNCCYFLLPTAVGQRWRNCHCF